MFIRIMMLLLVAVDVVSSSSAHILGHSEEEVAVPHGCRRPGAPHQRCAPHLPIAQAGSRFQALLTAVGFPHLLLLLVLLLWLLFVACTH